MYVPTSLCVTRIANAGATAPTSFCKCVCFKNSTIIALDDPDPDPGTSSRNLYLRQDDEELEEGSDEKKKPYRGGNCNDCSKQFCLDYNLPICRGATEEDVMTTCFREWPRRGLPCHLMGSVAALRVLTAGRLERDSNKDKAVVFLFIFMTTGLLGWALIRPWVENWMAVGFYDLGKQSCLA